MRLFWKAGCAVYIGIEPEDQEYLQLETDYAALSYEDIPFPSTAENPVTSYHWGFSPFSNRAPDKKKERKYQYVASLPGRMVEPEEVYNEVICGQGPVVFESKDLGIVLTDDLQRSTVYIKKLADNFYVASKDPRKAIKKLKDSWLAPFSSDQRKDMGYRGGRVRVGDINRLNKEMAECARSIIGDPEGVFTARNAISIGKDRDPTRIDKSFRSMFRYWRLNGNCRACVYEILRYGAAAKIKAANGDKDYKYYMRIIKYFARKTKMKIPPMPPRPKRKEKSPIPVKKEDDQKC